MRKRPALLILSILLLVSPLSAVPYYDNGSQIFTINAGATVPVSATWFQENNRTEWWLEGTRQSVGAYASLSYEVFLHPYFAIGGQLGFMFDYSNAGKIFTNVPVLLKVSAFPLQTGRWEIPISIGVGGSYMSYRDGGKFTFMATFEIGLRYYITESWGVGLHTGIQFVPEFYVKNIDSGMFTYMPITLSAAYRH